MLLGVDLFVSAEDKLQMLAKDQMKYKYPTETILGLGGILFV